MMSVHYKFKSTLDFETVTFDGLHISVADLKRSIVMQKHLGKITDFDLQITNAQTKEEYNDANCLIPKNTSLIIARIPLAQQPKKGWDPQAQDKQAQPRIPGKAEGVALDISKMQGSEEDKIQAMMLQSTADYDPKSYQRIRGQTQIGEVPASYRCNKCKKGGHWIKNCTFGSNKDHMEVKRTTGIPRSFRDKDEKALEAEIPEPPPLAESKQKVPEELVCSICNDLFNDAVMIPCCGNSFCDDCVRNALLESEDNECPDCKEKGSSPGSLIPNRFLRNSVNTFKNETGYKANQLRKAPTQQSSAANSNQVDEEQRTGVANKIAETDIEEPPPHTVTSPADEKVTDDKAESPAVAVAVTVASSADNAADVAEEANANVVAPEPIAAADSQAGVNGEKTPATNDQVDETPSSEVAVTATSTAVATAVNDSPNQDDIESDFEDNITVKMPPVQLESQRVVFQGERPPYNGNHHGRHPKPPGIDSSPHHQMQASPLHAPRDHGRRSPHGHHHSGEWDRDQERDRGDRERERERKYEMHGKHGPLLHGQHGPPPSGHHGPHNALLPKPTGIEMSALGLGVGMGGGGHFMPSEMQKRMMRPMNPRDMYHGGPPRINAYAPMPPLMSIPHGAGHGMVHEPMMAVGIDSMYQQMGPRPDMGYPPHYVRPPLFHNAPPGYMQMRGPPNEMRQGGGMGGPPNMNAMYQSVAAKVGSGIIDDPLEAFNRIMLEKEKRKEERRRSPERHRSRSLERMQRGGGRFRSSPYDHHRPLMRDDRLRELRDRSDNRDKRRERDRERDRERERERERERGRDREHKREKPFRHRRSDSFSDRSSRSRTWSPKSPLKRRSQSPPQHGRRSRSRGARNFGEMRSRHLDKDRRDVELRHDSPIPHMARRSRSRARSFGRQHQHQHQPHQQQQHSSWHLNNAPPMQAHPPPLMDKVIGDYNDKYFKRVDIRSPQYKPRSPSPMMANRELERHVKRYDEPPNEAFEPPPPGYELAAPSLLQHLQHQHQPPPQQHQLEHIKFSRSTTPDLFDSYIGHEGRAEHPELIERILRPRDDKERVDRERERERERERSVSRTSQEKKRKYARSVTPIAKSQQQSKSERPAEDAPYKRTRVDVGASRDKDRERERHERHERAADGGAAGRKLEKEPPRERERDREKHRTVPVKSKSRDASKDKERDKGKEDRSHHRRPERRERGERERSGVEQRVAHAHHAEKEVIGAERERERERERVSVRQTETERERVEKNSSKDSKEDKTDKKGKDRKKKRKERTDRKKVKKDKKDKRDRDKQRGTPEHSDGENGGNVGSVSSHTGDERVNFEIQAGNVEHASVGGLGSGDSVADSSKTPEFQKIDTVLQADDFAIEKQHQEQQEQVALEDRVVQDALQNPQHEHSQMEEEIVAAEAMQGDFADLYGDICEEGELADDILNKSVATAAQYPPSSGGTSPPVDFKRFDSVLDIHGYEDEDFDDFQNPRKKSAIAAPIPELSKWERDEPVSSVVSVASASAQRRDEASGSDWPLADEPPNPKVTTEVLRKAENAIFARAINAIRPIEVRRVSVDRQKLSRETSPTHHHHLSLSSAAFRDAGKDMKSFQITVPAGGSQERSVEIKGGSRKRSHSPRAATRSIKDRLGSKVSNNRSQPASPRSPNPSRNSSRQPPSQSTTARSAGRGDGERVADKKEETSREQYRRNSDREREAGVVSALQRTRSKEHDKKETRDTRRTSRERGDRGDRDRGRNNERRSRSRMDDRARNRRSSATSGRTGAEKSATRADRREGSKRDRNARDESKSTPRGKSSRGDERRRPVDKSDAELKRSKLDDSKKFNKSNNNSHSSNKTEERPRAVVERENPFKRNPSLDTFKNKRIGGDRLLAVVHTPRPRSHSRDVDSSSSSSGNSDSGDSDSDDDATKRKKKRKYKKDKKRSRRQSSAESDAGSAGKRRHPKSKKSNKSAKKKKKSKK